MDTTLTPNQKRTIDLLRRATVRTVEVYLDGPYIGAWIAGRKIHMNTIKSLHAKGYLRRNPELDAHDMDGHVMQMYEPTDKD